MLWTANTERYSEVAEGVHDTEPALRAAIDRNESEARAGAAERSRICPGLPADAARGCAAQVSPSTLFALACIDEGVPFINGSPQNTFVPGVVEAAVRTGVLIGGDDFKSGQTKMKSVLVDFLVGAGLKVSSIVSYNHLGNNDGFNLSAPQARAAARPCTHPRARVPMAMTPRAAPLPRGGGGGAQTFRSKEISKSTVVDDRVGSNELLYRPGEHPDHVVVIKYVPYVGDSKRAMDEYTSEIFMGGRNTIVMHNTCEDSLLAAPLILDLVLLAELCTRIELRRDGERAFHGLHPVSALLSYLTKAPLVPAGTPVVNALPKQRAMLENVLRACVGLPPENSMMLEHK